MEKSSINSETSISDLLREWPETIPVFQHYCMGCVGCTMSDYETVRSAAEVYQLPLDQFLADLTAVVNAGNKS